MRKFGLDAPHGNQHNRQYLTRPKPYMIDGDLTAVVSFIGVVVQLGGELLLVLLFILLRRYVLRRGYFAAWTAAWACGSVAIMAIVVARKV